MLVFVIMFHIEIPNCFKQCQYYARTADLFGIINLTFSVATALSSICNLQMYIAEIQALRKISKHKRDL